MTHDQRASVDVAAAEPATPVPPGRSWGRLGRYRMLAYAAVIVVLFTQMAVGMVTAAREQSTTSDEPVYIGAAVIYLQQRSFRYNYEHPPVAKLVIATGLAFANPKVDASIPGEWLLGTDVLYQHKNGAQRILFDARLPMIVLTMLFGLVVFLFARDLVGPVGGLVALTLYTFSPDVIAYGSLAGLDMPTAGFMLTALWMAWRARRRPVLYLPLAGIAVGTAVATKMSALPAVPIIMLLAVLSVWHAGRARSGPASIDRRRALRLLLAGAGAAVGVAVLSVLVVWAAYLIVDPRMRWSTPPDLPALPGLTGRIVDHLPYPRVFRDGMHRQLGIEDVSDAFNGFLLGDRYSGSKWYYLPAALLIKEPLGMLALWLAGAAAMLVKPLLRPAAVYVLAPTAILLLVAMSGERDFGVRYAIFVPVFLAVAAACVVTYRFRWAHVATVLLLAYVAVSSLRTFPYYLPYSNEAFGGPSKTYLRLGDSNVDWGQDMARLAKLVHEKYPGQVVWLNYKGRGSPKYYGIKARDPEEVPLNQVHGLIAISASRVPGPVPPWDELIKSSTRIGDVGHSIILYWR